MCGHENRQESSRNASANRSNDLSGSADTLSGSGDREEREGRGQAATRPSSPETSSASAIPSSPRWTRLAAPDVEQDLTSNRLHRGSQRAELGRREHGGPGAAVGLLVSLPTNLYRFA